MIKHSFKSWLIATRPWSFPASTMPVVTTLAYLYWLGLEVNWLIGVWTLLSIILFHASGNVWSDYYDFKKDDNIRYQILKLDMLIKCMSLKWMGFTDEEIEEYTMGQIV